jgi:hypothetical protein
VKRDRYGEPVYDPKPVAKSTVRASGSRRTSVEVARDGIAAARKRLAETKPTGVEDPE